MAYVINKSDGTAFTTLEDATINTDSSLVLVGRNYIGYGEAQNENFLFLLENFANSSAPARPIAGQLWFDTTVNVLKAYDGTKWVAVGSAAISATPPVDPPAGSFWFKTPINTLHTWDGTQWVFIGPEAVEGYGTTRARSTTLLSDTGITYPVILLTVSDLVVGIISTGSFTIASSNAIAGFSSLDAGITLSTSYNFKGNINGNASTATALDTLRTINGIGFDGTQNITIKASTTNKLIAGDYLLGTDFDGGTQQTWSVDATAANSIGKIVARNASGGFSAGLITANLAGDVTGNVTASTGTSRFNIVEANTFVGATLTGNAFSATKLRTARNINGVPFDGQSDITVTASARTLTDTALAAGIVSSQLESVGLLNKLDVNGLVTVSSNFTIGASGSDTNLTATRVLRLTANDGTDTSVVDLISPDVSSLAGYGAKGAIIPNVDQDLDLGKSGRKWDKVHANTFVGDLQGNADTATLATTATNLAGGAAGSIAYQTASGTTALLPAGSPDQVLASRGTAAPPVWVDNVYESSQAVKLKTSRTINGVSFDGTANITITDNTRVALAGDTMTGFLTLHANPTANLHATPKQYVDSAIATAIATVATPLWAGATTLSNVTSTFAGYAAGTRVSFWNERVYNAPRYGNGGAATVYDRYKETVEKQSNGTWITVG